MAEQSGKGGGGAKWQWRSNVAMTEQSYNGGAKWQWRSKLAKSKQSGDAAN